MTSSSTPTVPALDESLRDLVDWERVAIHLPEMNQPIIDKIKRDKSGIDNQKQALYDVWLRKHSNATWIDVKNALETVCENTLAESLKRKLHFPTTATCTRNIDTKEITENIDEGVVIELNRLHKAFECTAKEVETRCGHLVASNETSLDDLAWPFCRSKSVYGIHNVQSIHEFFQLLSDHYTFLDCDLLETVVQQLPQSDELLAKVHNHKENIRKFKRETPILSLQNKLEPFITQAHLKRLSLKVVFVLEDAWGARDLRLF